MRFSTVAATIAAVAPLANAHASNLPGIVGLDVKDVRVRSMLAQMEARSGHGIHSLESRQGASPKECGEGIGSCPAGKCCSEAGYCGSSPAHCEAPLCQWKYGPGCPENNPPKGENTEKWNRNKAGKVPYGGIGVYGCVVNNVVALTYDDGPMKKFTSHILDLFKKYNAKGTFFVTGDNNQKGRIDETDEYIDVIKRMDKEGHQIGSHTWTHQDLSKISSKERTNQMVYNEMALNNIIGKIPTYMRPPYSSCTAESGCMKQLADLGYHVTNFRVNTDDYNQPTADLPKEWFKGNITSTGNNTEPWISISHDIIEHTAMDLTEFMLKTVTDLGYKLVTVGECLGDPKGNWYRTSNGTAYVAESEYPKLDGDYPNVIPSGGYPTPTPDPTSSGASPTGTGAGASGGAGSAGGDGGDGGSGAASISRNALISAAALLVPAFFAFA